MTTLRASLGRRGERVAARFLKRRGYRILHRNWRCPSGEIDLVCADGATLVFVEVKSRSGGGLVPPEVGVGRLKRRKLERLALHYLAARALVEVDWRFDVVSVTLGRWRRPAVRIFQGAF
ncbi:MAG: YraN family protein [bacterium]|nr:YraN family protein [bacterium]MCZ6700831.1 YraN family protein [bacterium]MDV2479477.1 YraN family protein [bacterium]